MTEENPFTDDLGDDEQVIYCWRDTSRACNVDCVAFDERSLGDERFNACILINIKRADSKSLSMIGTQLKRHTDLEEKSSQRFYTPSDEEVAEGLRRRQAEQKKQSEDYAQKVKELDREPPEVKP